ncbi:MAG: MBL fold metallo-hydrolase [Enterobacterales bacterium]|nr:MBL fold metallo-hydrolase [Enterobacterales bacterium]
MTTFDTKAFFEPNTFTVTYLISDKQTKQAAIIDAVLDFSAKSGTTSTKSADQIIDYINDNGPKLKWIFESHAHADHLSAAPHLKKALGGQTAIGAEISQVQETFKKIFNLEKEFLVDGSQFDKLLNEGDTLDLGNTSIKVLHTPGHTPACVSYLLEDTIFVGDTLFMPDFGTARADFPGGDAKTLYQSIKKILSLPDHTKIYVGHDYLAPGRDNYAWESTVAQQKAENIHVKEHTSEQEFVEYRTKRDSTLEVPDLILPSVQVNIRAGDLPPQEDNGVSYLKLPINLL